MGNVNMAEMLTWGFLFRRLWRLVVLRFAKQRMCEECGDALVEWHRGIQHHSETAWACESCEEWRAIQERNKPKPSPEEIEMQRRFAEMLMSQPGMPIRLGVPHYPPGSIIPVPSRGMLGHIGGALGGNPFGNIFGRLQ